MTDPQHDLVNAVDQLRKTIEQLRDELVRKDVFDQVLRNISDRFKAVEKDISDIEGGVEKVNGRIDRGEQDRKADRRLLIAAFIGPFVMLLIGVYIYAQVGGTPT